MHTSVQSQVKIALQARTTDWCHEIFLLCDFWLVFACIDGGITSECERKLKRVQISILVEGLQSAIFSTKGTHPMGKCRQSHDSELCHHSVSFHWLISAKKDNTRHKLPIWLCNYLRIIVAWGKIYLCDTKTAFSTTMVRSLLMQVTPKWLIAKWTFHETDDMLWK